MNKNNELIEIIPIILLSILLGVVTMASLYSVESMRKDDAKENIINTQVTHSRVDNTPRLLKDARLLQDTDDMYNDGYNNLCREVQGITPETLNSLFELDMNGELDVALTERDIKQLWVLEDFARECNKE
jgi:hypothetical protein